MNRDISNRIGVKKHVTKTGVMVKLHGRGPGVETRLAYRTVGRSGSRVSNSSTVFP